MEELKVIGIEDGALIAVSDEGDRFRVAIDAVMQTKLRQLNSQRATTARISPRDIQAHVRAGMSREQVAAATGASVEDIERYEGPVLAEREHMLSQALSTVVQVAGDDRGGRSFGTVIRERLAGLEVSAEHWACWKDEVRGWMVKVEFTADDIDHDARWSFDPRAQSLQPLNSEAITLSQQGEIKGGLIPKLRAVDAEHERTDTSRFDSGQFVFRTDDLGSDLLGSASEILLDVVPEPSSPAAAAAATNRLEEPARPKNDTADLLEALRKRRGERQVSSGEFDIFAEHTDETETLVIERETVSITRDTAESSATDGPSLWASAAQSAESREERAQTPTVAELPKRRSGRTSLPSWDEIVLGGRHDDDPA